MATLKRGLEHILKNYGHNILLQRWNDDTQTFECKLERHTVRHMYPAVRGVPKVEQNRVEGVVHDVDMIYYFDVTAAPKERDRIYERDAGLGKESRWIIDYAIPMRWHKGKILFFEVGATREWPE